MSAGNRIIAVLGVGLVAAAGFGLYSLGMNRGMQMGAGTVSSTPMTDQANGGEGAAAPADRKVLYWHDPMVPGQKFDKPGKSPFMDMQLVPVYAGNDGDESRVSISPRVQQNLGVRTAEVVRGALIPTLEVVGSVAYNDRDVALVQARTTGFVEKLNVRAPLDAVRRGQVLGEMVVPEWSAAQEEYLSARRIAGAAGGLPALADAARQRMHLVGLSDEQIAAIEATGEIRPRFKIIAPATGVITELSAREGMTVMAGAPLFRINGLATVWINAEVPENFAAQVRPGIAVEARTPALPGIVFNGKVSAILPDVNAATRTLKARIEVANRKGQLVPGMFATVKFASPARKDTLLVPTEAVIATGKRTVVMVALADGKFAPTDVELGLENNGQTEVRKGLEAGQKVVVSGQFLIDSEASLRSTVTRMSDAPMVGASASGGAGEAGVHHGVGRVEAIGKDEITLSHEPIASLKWGPMTMGFKAPAAGLPKSIGVGDRVTFDIRAANDGMFEITRIAADAMPPKPAAGAMPGGPAASSAQPGAERVTK